MVRPNIVVLRQLHQTLPAAQKMFAMLAEQPELGDHITVDELIDNLELGRRNAVDLLREVAEAGAGEFRLGRKGHPSRLVWSTDPRSVVDGVLSRQAESAKPEPLDDDPGAQVQSQREPPPPFEPERPNGRAHDFPASTPKTIDHVFVLRPDLRISVTLPIDLGAREAAVLGDWIRNLSFER
ncbi:hypothetical protein ACNOYE_16985 [Nannocystaceae bacterium ST9]